MTSVHAIITTFDAPDGMLARAVASVLACSDVERVTVVDDGSNRRVEVERDVRVEVVRQPNAGPSSARNAGLERVRSNWAIMLDDDDELIAAGVAGALDLAQRLGAVGAVVGRVSRDERGRECVREAPAGWAGGALPHPGDAFRPLQLFNASGTVVARGAIEAGVRYDPGLRIGEDREFVRRLAAIGPVAVASGVAVRAGVRPDGERLTSVRHLIRRATDHMTIMERWIDEESLQHFREGTRWLLNAMSKSGLGGEPSYGQLLEIAVDRGWIGPIDRLRLAIRAGRAANTIEGGKS